MQQQLWQMSWITGIHFLHEEGIQWIESKTGQKLVSALSSVAYRPGTGPGTVDDGQSPAPAPQSTTTSNVKNGEVLESQNPTDLTLPDTFDFVFMHLERFRYLRLRHVFPVVDPDVFVNTITTAYQTPEAEVPYGYAGAKACIFAFLSFVSVLYSEEYLYGPEQTFLIKNGSLYEAKAQRLVPQMLQEPASLDIAQTMMILVSALNLTILPYRYRIQ